MFIIVVIDVVVMMLLNIVALVSNTSGKVMSLLHQFFSKVTCVSFNCIQQNRCNNACDVDKKSMQYILKISLL
jgi:hypothetical protein